MKYQIFLIIIILVVLYYLVFYKSNDSTNSGNSNKIENFDARISDISKEQCGNFCTKIYGCIGFSYDDSNQKCYISHNPILGDPPSDSLYKSDYDPSFEVCNKPFPIKNEIDEDQESAYPKNTIYTCSQEASTLDKYQYIDGESKKLQDNDKVINSPYKLKQLYWPSRKKDLDANYITNNDIFNNIIFYEKDDVNEHLGQYMFQHKCVNDIPLNVCLQKCALEDECEGVEYNPMLLEKVSVNGEDKKQTLLQRKNVCCLKKNIKNKIKRRKEHESGSFYTKKLEDQAYLTNIYIKV